MKKAIVIMLVFSVTAATSAFGGSRQSEVYGKETKSFDMEPGGYVDIQADDGYIRINTWDQDRVEVVMNKRAWGRNQREAERNLDNIEIDINHRGDRLYIHDVTDKENHRNIGLLDLIRGNWEFGSSVDFEIMMPKNMNLELTADDGDVSVTDLEGEITVDIDDGDLNFENLSTNRIEITMDDGDIDFDNVRQMTEAERALVFISFDDGNVDVRRTEMEEFEIGGDDGDITLLDVTVKNLEIDLDDGDFDGDLEVKPSGRIRVIIDDGDAIMNLPEDISAYFNLYAYDGRIRTDFPVEVERDEERAWVKDRTRDGDINIRAEVTNGYISIRYR
ncbi:DUF4097 family beta strand repeat-containing protein [candidate division KSB1 bacterium]